MEQTEEALISIGEDSTEHTYDPMEEIRQKQAEEEFRTTAEIADKTVLFSVKETRGKNDKPTLLADSSPLCKEYGLKR